MAISFGVLTVLQFRRALENDVVTGLLDLAEQLASVMEPEDDGRFTLELTRPQIDAFSIDYPTGPYYRIWSSDKQVVDYSSLEIPDAYPTSMETRRNADQMEVVVAGPLNAKILVGRSIAVENQRVQQLMLHCGGVSGVLLLLMIAGGWLLIGRALGPIRRITIAAASVTEDNLSKRIDVSQMATELVELSETFNHTFSRIEEAFDRQARFTSDASHELRTPLTVLLARCEHIRHASRTNQEYESAIDSIASVLKKMHLIVERLLTLARAEAKTPTCELERCSLHHIVESVCEFLGPLALQKEIALTHKLAHAEVLGDGPQLREVVTNLVDNAVQYTEQGGTVHVELKRVERCCILSVTDTGSGISPEHCKHVFERFYRADPARQSRSSGGTGIGLAIAKSLVEAHGGTIEVESQVSIGSVFRVLLPLLE